MVTILNCTCICAEGLIFKVDFKINQPIPALKSYIETGRFQTGKFEKLIVLNQPHSRIKVNHMILLQFPLTHCIKSRTFKRCLLKLPDLDTAILKRPQL